MGKAIKGHDRMAEEEIQTKFSQIVPYLDERSKRLWCANEALALGWGGITMVSNATGVSRTTITTGIHELTGERELSEDRSRRRGGGRKKNC